MKPTPALLKASHFPQTLAMTVFLGISAWLTGVNGVKLLVLTSAVLFGQFSVGWLNDFIDLALDRQSGRSEKPLVAGALKLSSLKIAILIAAILAIPLSIVAAGWLGGLAHISAIFSAYCYNLWLARTIWSWLPYVLSFGLLPVFIAQAASAALWPESAMILLFSLVGVIAHLLNAVPDIEIDRQADKGGLAVSLGRRRSMLLAALLAIAALCLAGFLLAGNAQVLDT